MIRRTDQILKNPTVLVALLCVGQIVAWTLAPALTHSAPPLDVVEGYMWGREWVIATYKHPALPSWVLEASRVLAAGAVGWPAYLASQLFVAATFIFAFLLGRDIMGPRRAAAGTLLLTGIAFYAWPTPEFNHNIAETPFWAALPWALWRAVERRRIGWWVLVGVLGAGGLYAKLMTALLLLAVAAWIFWDARARQCLATFGPWIGLAAFLALATPLAIWLVTHDFILFRYAAEQSLGSSGGGVLKFIPSVALNLVGIPAIMAIAGLIWPWRRPPAGNADAEPQHARVAARALRYLLVVTLGPLAIALVMALLTGSGLEAGWSSPMFNLAGLLAVALTSAHFDSTALRRIAISAAVIIVIVPVANAIVIAAAPLRAGAPVRVSWPQAAISERFAAIWARETGRPLRIVGGDDWVAGLVGLTAKDRPSILNRGDLTYSPWITPERMAREGMLIVWEDRSRKIPPQLQPLVAARPAREVRFIRKRTQGRGDLVIGYAIVAPK